MGEIRTTIRVLTGVVVAAALATGTDAVPAGTVDASHVDWGHALQSRSGSARGQRHQCRARASRSPGAARADERGGATEDEIAVPLGARPAGKGERVGARIATAPWQEQDLHAFIEPLSPLPGQVLAEDSPHAYVAARIAANAAITHVELRLDNVVIRPEILGRDDADASVLYQPRRWRVGWHSIRVRVWDAGGQISERLWTFRMTR